MQELGSEPLPEFSEADGLLELALAHGDALATSKESQMLINLKGVSIGARPRKDGRYQGYIALGEETKYFYGATREEVATKIKYYLREVQIQGRKKPKKEKSSPLFGEYVEKWIRLYKEPNLKPTSLDSVKSSLIHAQKAFGNRKINTITGDDVQELLLSVSAERMRNICKLYLNQVFQKAFKEGLVKRNPCDSVEIKNYKSKRKKALTVEEQAVFLKAAKETKYDLLFRLLIATGLRIGEALALRRSDVDFTGQTLSVSKNVVFVRGKRIEQDTPKTKAGNRTVPLTEELCSELDSIETDLLFPYSYNALKCCVDRISANIGVKMSLHVLRHTYATRLEEAGIPAKVKQYLMGHSSLDMTENVYTDTQKAYVERVSDKIRQIF